MARCSHAGAMRRIKNQATGENFQPHYNPNTKNKMYEGVYYEMVVNNIQKIPQKDLNEGFVDWYILHTEGTRKQQEIAKKIERYGYYMASEYGLRDHTKNISLRGKLSFDFAGFEINLEIDRVGARKISKENYLSRVGSPNIFTTTNNDLSVTYWVMEIQDMKWTGDITHVFEVGESTPDEDHIQVLPYSMYWAYENATEEGKALFMQAMQAMYAELTGEEHGAGEKAKKLIKDFAKTTQVLNGTYIICEDTDVPVYGDKFYPPHHRIQEFEILAEDYLMCFWYYYARFRQVRDAIISGNEYDRKVALIVRADAHKCLGKQSGGARRGKCPMLYACVYGRRFVGGHHSIPIGDVINSAISNLD